MNKEQKLILKNVCKNIPKENKKFSKKTLWRKYASDFNYGTFVKYFNIFALNNKGEK